MAGQAGAVRGMRRRGVVLVAAYVVLALGGCGRERAPRQSADLYELPDGSFAVKLVEPGGNGSVRGWVRVAPLHELEREAEQKRRGECTMSAEPPNVGRAR